MGGGQVVGVIKALGLTSVLFAGVIREKVGTGEVEVPSLRAFAPRTQTEFMECRNYVAAPFVEEFVFRAATLFLLKPHFSTTFCVCFSTASFALAHVHHLYLYLTSHKIPLAQSLKIVLANFLIHSTFALFSTFIYTHTGSLLAATLAHSYCNYLGAPSFDFLSFDDRSLSRQIGAAHVLGIIGFFASAIKVSRGEW
eukprot:TRINITY_DN9074_c0_g1_i1.p1 TRINITY_DN9074_c0_g1~~TRINITY_DN9074_c0_g1_i1.p1  ORF type:complete len:206 (+),score=22.99 TRINITY_DN9074_c0_g1_i1:28-618(+)